MSIKGQIKDNISYNGNIKVTINDRGHKSELKFHNSGTKLLFDTITKALAGYSIEGETPQYIDIKYSQDNVTFTSALYSPVIITGKIFGDPAGAGRNTDFGIVQMNAEIDHSVKIDGIEAEYWQLQLLNSSTGILAIVDNSNDVKEIYNAITGNHEVIIEWALQFSNPT